jgi:hypothetical protein
MATQKRRVIYLSDLQWEAAKRGAKANEETISAYIGMLVEVAARPEMRIAQAIQKTVPDFPVYVGPPPTFRPVPKPSQRRK